MGTNPTPPPTGIRAIIDAAAYRPLRGRALRHRLPELLVGEAPAADPVPLLPGAGTVGGRPYRPHGPRRVVLHGRLPVHEGGPAGDRDRRHRREVDRRARLTCALSALCRPLHPPGRSATAVHPPPTRRTITRSSASSNAGSSLTNVRSFSFTSS